MAVHLRILLVPMLAASSAFAQPVALDACSVERLDKPEYPALARHPMAIGTITARFEVRPDGGAGDLQVRGYPPVLRNYVELLLGRSRLAGTCQGRKIEVIYKFEPWTESRVPWRRSKDATSVKFVAPNTFVIRAKPRKVGPMEHHLKRATL